jgi:glycosyltransferase involved in cell wall biosynthesis
LADLKALMLHSENSAVGKYRIWQPAKYLERIGWDISRIPDATEAIKVDHKEDGDECWECRAQGSDIVVMQRPDQPDSIALAMALREQYDCPLVFEVDDNIYDVAKSSTSYQYWYPGSPLIEIAELMMKEADALTVSTPELVQVYKHLNPNIYVLPNYQDPEDWEQVVRKAADPNKVVIGWQGSSTHYDDLHLIRRPLKKLLRNYPKVEFHVQGLNADFLADHPQIKISTQWSKPAQWPKRLGSLGYDIGIAPVVDRPFNRGKSNIKWQEYSMVGIPTVASRVGEYKEIEHGVTGFLARDESEWYFYLEQLVKHLEQRESIGQQAHQYTLEHNLMGENIAKWDAAYRDIIRIYKSRV